MNNEYLVISCSLNPGSNSRTMAREIFQLLDKKVGAQWLDLQDYSLPQCDGRSAYGHPQVAEVTEKIRQARCIIMAVPIYNYAVAAAAKNLIELSGEGWQDKVVGFVCAAGGRLSYMSVLGLANSLMLDFRAVIIPRFVYADASSFQDGQLNDQKIVSRLQELADSAIQLSGLLPAVA